jgi:hypothetical protein
VIVPSASAERFRVALHAPLEQVPLAVAAPEATLTVRPSSEQVPDTAKADTPEALIKELAAGPVIARVGTPVSLTKLREAWVAALPAASLWLAVTVIVPSANAETLRVALQAPLAQVPEAVAAPEATLTVRPFSEQVPETANAVTLAALTKESAAGVVIARVGGVASRS